MKKIVVYVPGLLIVFIAVLAGCKKKEGSDCPDTTAYKALTTSAKEWFPYISNRILIFENSTLMRDTVELRNYFLAEDEVWNGDKCPVTKAEFLRGNIIDKKSGDTIQAELSNGDQIIFRKKTGYLYYLDNSKVLLQSSASRRFESTITLNNKSYTSVLVFECTSDDKCSSTGISRFYVSKTKGLVAYSRNNVLWTLK